MISIEGIKMKLKLYIAVLLALGFSGCTNSANSLNPSTSRVTYEKPTAAKLEVYQKTMRRVASGIKDDPNYHKIALDTAEKKAWFRELTYKLWDRQITRDQFVSKGLKKYPTHKYEFDFIVRGFSL